MSTELSAKIAEQLTNRAGIPSQGYKKSPVVHSGFIASIYHNKLWIWLTAKTKIRITPSKKHGQAVVIVKEGKRNISTVWIARLQIITAYGDSFTTISKRILSGIIDTHVPIGIPGTDLEYKHVLSKTGHKEVKRFVNGHLSGHRSLSVSIKSTISVPPTQTNLLVGTDEHKLFICALPEEPKNVEHAHEILRPEGVPEDSLRQGEWFFVPITDEEARMFFKKPGPAEAEIARVYGIPHVNRSATRLEAGSSHYVNIQLTRDEQSFVIGRVYDERPDRHSELFLGGLHKAIRNREIVFNQPERTKYWD